MKVNTDFIKLFYQNTYYLYYEKQDKCLKFQAAEAPYFLYERKNNKKAEMHVLKTLAYLLDDMKMLLEEEA